MNAPDKIYVPLTINLLTKRQVLRLDATDVKPISFANENVPYIRKEALLEWAKKENEKFNKSGNEDNNDFQRGMAAGMGFLISALTNKF